MPPGRTSPGEKYWSNDGTLKTLRKSELKHSSETRRGKQSPVPGMPAPLVHSALSYETQALRNKQLSEAPCSSGANEGCFQSHVRHEEPSAHGDKVP